MESNANFIPLGAVGEKAYFDTGEKLAPQGKTKEERKDIARRIRLAAKKEKKKIKSDAKKQRKQNAIMHRRATKNPEKYVKNKDRNAVRALDQERNKIRLEAVRQAERLAAKYDPSGKMFNVGEVMTLPDGRVKNKDMWKWVEESKKAREAGAEEEKEAAQQPLAADGMNPERAALLQTGPNAAVKHNPKVSKQQQKKLAALAPKPVPPRPILPENISLPEGEENFIALWDITDQEIKSRLSAAKSKKKQAAKALRRQQKEQKKFNRALKVKKKQYANQGMLWDPEKAKREILGEMSDEKDSDDSDSDSDSDAEEAEGDKNGNQTGGTKESEDTEMADAAEETQSTPAKNDKLKDRHKYVPKLRKELLKPEEIQKRLAKEKKRARKELKRSEELSVVKAKEEAELIKKREAKEAKKQYLFEERKRRRAGEANEEEEPKESKKRKRPSEDQPEDAEVKKAEKSLKKQKKKEKKEAEAAEAKKEEAAANGHAQNGEQWNADALSGDAARKDKFLRLLGAGKANGSTEEAVKPKKSSKKGTADISHVESELERQYETGMKMKHDGQGKRRGIGA